MTIAPTPPPASPSTARRWLVPGLGYVVALLVFFALRWPHLEAMLASPVGQIQVIDAAYYLGWGQRIADGLGFGPHPFFLSPLYPLFIALAGTIGDGFVASTLQLQTLLSAGSLLLIGRYAGRRIRHPLGGPFAALLYAIYAPSIYYDGVLLSASLILFLTMCALVLLDDPPATLPLWRVAAAGLAIGLSALARPNALILLPAFMLVFLHWGKRYGGRPSNFKRGWIRSAVLIAACVLVILPAMIRNVRLGGEFTLTTSSAGVNLWIGNHENATGLYTEAPFLGSADPANEALGYKVEASRHVGRELGDLAASRYWLGEALEAIARDPIGWLGLEVKKLAWFAHDVESPNNVSLYAARDYSPQLRRLALFGFGVLIAFGVPGLFMFGAGRAMHLPRALLLAYLVANLLFFVAGEYRYPVVGVLLMGTAVTVFRVVRHFRAHDPVPALRALIAAVVLIVFTHAPYDRMEMIASPESDYFNWASVSFDQGDLVNASLLFSAALAERPNWREAHLQLALVFQQMGMSDLAMTEFNAAGVREEDITRLLREEARLASEWFTPAADSLQEMSSSRLATLAARFNVLGRHGAALSAAEVALEKDSTNLEAKFEQAFALEATGHLTAAIQRYQRVEYLTQDDPMPAFRIAWCYFSLNKPRDAQQALLRAQLKAQDLPAGEYKQNWLAKIDDAEKQIGNF